MSTQDHSQTNMPGPAIPKLLLTSKEASLALSVSQKTLWTYTKEFSIPTVKIGRLIRYDPDDLKKFIQNRKEGH